MRRVMTFGQYIENPMGKANAVFAARDAYKAEYMEKFEQIGSNFDLAQLYESVLLQDNVTKRKQEDVYERIKQDEVKITHLIGNNGEIFTEELQKIQKRNLDKMRKLV